ncbi:GIY-YIG nuclease family protein [Halomonas sp. A29]|uniref:GIY-YIG nuclease family protein n=1 Tax=Halomonas sp. A29 TaxID=3102786 RepID=UPI00398B5415
MSVDSSYYVYALKDPRQDPALPFYVGKGTGIRSYDHLVKPDESRKGARIREIEAEGHQVLVTRLVDSLTEIQALRLEAELIAAFGTIDSGGLLTNSVLPTGLGAKTRASIVLPSGVKEKAQLGLSLLKEAILEFAKANPKGISNSEAASLLGLRSDYGGGSKDYLSYSVIGLLMREGKLERDGASRKHVARVR